MTTGMDAYESYWEPPESPANKPLSRRLEGYTVPEHIVPEIARQLVALGRWFEVHPIGGDESLVRVKPEALDRLPMLLTVWGEER